MVHVSCVAFFFDILWNVIIFPTIQPCAGCGFMIPVESL
uniref:Uncharacterized protein n=1 Tax=Arundo donax TaxID=35708 RepID=A0A0A8Z4H6_ARUDO